MKRLLVALLSTMTITACTVSYSFRGIDIDYTKVKTMEIRYFPNQAPSDYPETTITFNQYLQDFFTRSTKLTFVDAGGDLELEGEITGYNLTPLAVTEMSNGTDGSQLRASQTRLTMTVKIRYRNNVNPGKDKEETITAYRDFDSSIMFDDVRSGLDDELTKDIVDQIFNTTLSDW